MSDRTPYEEARLAFDGYAAMDAPGLPEDRDSALQVRLARWQTAQFGAAPNHQPVLGMTEELGELAEAVLALMAAQGRVSHATLKAEQRIRGFGDQDKVRAFIADAIADYDIFAEQLCTAMRLDRGALKRATAEKVLKRNWKADPKTGGQL
jgi:NTP pyrophosphatase (non-canonical NTP hydrolase)